jgi:threonine dehydrogenase-like Zn-dependent dehydrogenase
MRAVTVIPGQQGSVALTDMPEPPAADGPVLVQTQAIGVCGTDLEIINGEYGWAPPGQERLIIGHESLGQVAQAPPGSGFAAGDLVVGIVRRPDPAPCSACAAGDWDMCTNGGYTERGIKARHGYAAERYRIRPEYLVAVDPALGVLGVLLEPATVVAKAWDHIEKIGARSTWAPRTVLITGAGPIGLLAALLSIQRGYDAYVVDLVTEGRKPNMVRGLGGFALLADHGHDLWRRAAGEAEESLGVAVAVQPVDPGSWPEPAEPPAGTAGDGWTGAALIRPDGVIAWKPQAPAAEAAGQLAAVVAGLLSRSRA